MDEINIKAGLITLQPKMAVNYSSSNWFCQIPMWYRAIRNLRAVNYSSSNWFCQSIFCGHSSAEQFVLNPVSLLLGCVDIYSASR